jgi:hypothetical protein
MQGRRLVTAVFLTYNFEPDFFEQEIVPTLLNLPLQHTPALRLLQLEDALKSEVNDITVYYDRAALLPGNQSAKLDIRRIPVSYPTGAFHPKNLLLLTETLEADERGNKPRSLIVATLSANLTRAGWWENVEACHIEDVHEGALCSFRDDLLELIRRIRGASRAEENHTGLEAIRSFALGLVQRQQRSANGILQARLYTSEQSVPAFLAEVCGSELVDLCLEVISPYFDETDARPLRDLCDQFMPREIRVLLPKADDGAALCSTEYYQAVRSLKNARWGQLPSERTRAGKNEQVKHRRVHAKVYRFFHPHRRYEVLFVGSVNLTNAAHSRGGNFETAFLVQTDLGHTPDWWLEVDSRKPDVFMSGEAEEIASVTTALSVRFDWDGDKAEAFWDRAAPSGNLTISAQGATLFNLESLPPRSWQSLPVGQAMEVKRILASTSFLGVSEDGGPPALILVQEEGMAYKPSLLFHLSAAEILRYWALLTPEQRAAFLAERIGSIPEAIAQLGGTSPTLAPTSSSLFDTFAGIYHAFHALERYVLLALEERRPKEAEFRLLGEKYDSLHNLLNRVLQETQDDPVNRYVIVLCAKQLVKEVELRHPAFRKQHRDRFRALKQRITEAERIRQDLSFGTREERTAFLRWFDEWFLTRSRVSAVAS